MKLEGFCYVYMGDVILLELVVVITLLAAEKSSDKEMLYKTWSNCSSLPLFMTMDYNINENRFSWKLTKPVQTSFFGSLKTGWL
jgi:uncharacterized membrane protein